MLNKNFPIDKAAVQPQPVAPGERIFALDVIRGFALFGVLLAYALWNLGSPGEETFSQSERVLNWVLTVLVDTKAYTLFATLFGFGFSIQLIRAESRGGSFVPVYRRRLLALMGIGFAHAFLLRNGDILVPYAVMGFVLLLFRKASNKMLLAGAIFALIFPYLAQAVLEYSGGQLPKRPEPAGLSYLHENALWVFYWYKTAAFEWSQSLPMFFFGLYLGRRYFQQNTFVNPQKLGFIIIGGLVFGLLAYAAIEWLAVPQGQKPSFGQVILSRQLWKIHAWALAAFYASSLLWLLRYPSWQKLFAPLAAVGRMALTNYLMQAVIIVPVCIIYGLFDNVTPGIGLLLALDVWIFQILLSVWWFKHFRFGPVEWFWRRLTYGQKQPMRAIEKPATAVPV
jgi:uncharacterized protein